MFQGVQMNNSHTLAISYENMVAEWGCLPYSQLSVLLVHLRYLSLVHQNHHWITSGESFFGDHQLFQSLYEQVQTEVDVLAEKVIGLGTTDNVNMTLQVIQLQKLLSSYNDDSTIPSHNEYAKRSLCAEKTFISTCNVAMQSLAQLGLLTKGLDNLLAAIIDTHEKHVYLLKQRCSVKS